ncbi:hypothetical protein [Bacillus sp. AK128]
MRLVVDLLFLVIISYYAYKFIEVLIRLKKEILLPTTEEEISVIRIYPQKTVKLPSYSSQKVGIIVYSIMLLYVIGMFTAGSYFNQFEWTIYLLVLLPLTYSGDLLNLFAFTRDGLLKGSRFIPWRKIKSYSFADMDYNSNFYGFSKEADKGYELKIQTRYRVIRCVVTTEEMKDRIDQLLAQHVSSTFHKG